MNEFTRKLGQLEVTHDVVKPKHSRESPQATRESYGLSAKREPSHKQTSCMNAGDHERQRTKGAVNQCEAVSCMNCQGRVRQGQLPGGSADEAIGEGDAGTLPAGGTARTKLQAPHVFVGPAQRMTATDHRGSTATMGDGAGPKTRGPSITSKFSQGAASRGFGGNRCRWANLTKAQRNFEAWAMGVSRSG